MRPKLHQKQACDQNRTLVLEGMSEGSGMMGLGFSEVKGLSGLFHEDYEFGCYDLVRLWNFN